MVETLDQLECHVGLLTETWFKESKKLTEDLKNLKHMTNYETFCRNRDTGNGGGVAIMYKKGDLQMTQLKTGEKYEIVATIGRQTGQHRKFVVIAAYAPPNYTANENRGFLTRIADLVRNYKTKYQAPYIIVDGDFNYRTIEDELREFRDLKLVKTPPTRGNNTLDLVFPNFKTSQAGVVEPVATVRSDKTLMNEVYVKEVR